MSDWIALPFPVDGPNGKYRIIDETIMFVYLYGTDHPSEWRMHYPDRGKRIRTNVGMVNQGYYEHAIDVYYWIQENHPRVNRFYIGGHSFGGAIAQILGAHLSHYGHTALVTTFGTIRAGRIRKRFLAGCVNYIHWFDVAYLWPLWPFYSLHGNRIRFGRFGWPWDVHQPPYYRTHKLKEGFQ